MDLPCSQTYPGAHHSEGKPKESRRAAERCTVLQGLRHKATASAGAPSCVHGLGRTARNAGKPGAALSAGARNDCFAQRARCEGGAGARGARSCPTAPPHAGRAGRRPKTGMSATTGVRRRAEAAGGLQAHSAASGRAALSPGASIGPAHPRRKREGEGKQVAPGSPALQPRRFCLNSSARKVFVFLELPGASLRPATSSSRQAGGGRCPRTPPGRCGGVLPQLGPRRGWSGGRRSTPRGSLVKTRPARCEAWLACCFTKWGRPRDVVVGSRPRREALVGGDFEPRAGMRRLGGAKPPSLLCGGGAVVWFWAGRENRGHAPRWPRPLLTHPRYGTGLPPPPPGFLLPTPPRAQVHVATTGSRGSAARGSG